MDIITQGHLKHPPPAAAAAFAAAFERRSCRSATAAAAASSVMAFANHRRAPLARAASYFRAKKVMPPHLSGAEQRRVAKVELSGRRRARVGEFVPLRSSSVSCAASIDRLSRANKRRRAAPLLSAAVCASRRAPTSILAAHKTRRQTTTATSCASPSSSSIRRGQRCAISLAAAAARAAHLHRLIALAPLHDPRARV